LKDLTHLYLKQPKKAGDVVARGVDDLVEAFALAALSTQEDQNIAGKQQRGNLFQKQGKESLRLKKRIPRRGHKSTV
jgi:hypothetical protein